MKKAILYISLLLNSWGWAQTNLVSSNKYNLKIKSPDAGQLSKHIDIPASTYSGTFGVDIPIYNIKIDDYSLPISLKYHASGIKVKEIASKIGLGWTLSVGGISLSKQVFGAEDKGAIPNIKQADDAFNLNNTASADHRLAIEITGFNAFDPDSPLIERKWDTQPDIFSYSVGNTAGDYYFDSSGKVVKIPPTDVKIEGNSLITDPEGNQYFFSTGNLMSTIGGSLPSSEDVATTEFVIDKIVLNSGKEIKFEYQQGEYQYLSNYYKGFVYPFFCTTSNNSEYNEYASLTNMMHERYLDKIIFPEGYVKLTYNNNRQDIINGISLENIAVYNNYDKLISNYQLNKSYFISNDLVNVRGYANQIPSLSKRLKLNEVRNTVENSSYILTYYENKPLPNRFSDATDYMGFSNGQDRNSGIPYVIMDDKIYGKGDNKEPNIDFAVSGSLKEITYPTKGKMKIEYELDDFYFQGDEVKAVSKGFTECGNGLITATKEFTVNTNRSYVDFKFNFNSSYNPVDDGSGSLPIGSYVMAEILDQNDIVLKQFLLTGEYEYRLEKKNLYKIRFRKMGSGDLDTSIPMPCLVVDWFEINSTYKEYNKSIGGIRVKKVTKSNENNAHVIEERFVYKDNNGVSTGRFFGDPVNYYYTIDTPDGYFGSSCTKLIISNSGNFNLSTINGKPTAYEKVITERVAINNPSKRWKIIDTYSLAGSTNAYNSDTPFMTFANNKFANGLLMKKEFYDSDNNLVRKIENTYSKDYYFNQKSNDYLAQFPELTMRPYQLFIKSIYLGIFAGGYPSVYSPVFGIKRYDITSGWIKNMQSKITNYFNDKELKETTEYVYDSHYKHMNPINKKQTFTDDSFDKINFSYAHEKGNQLLISKNMIGIPLETTTTQTRGTTTRTLSKTETIYPLNQTEANAKTSGLVLPLSLKSFDLQNPASATTEVIYDQYDSKGNILQYTTKDGISTTIIWGYNQTQPIARIEGATYTQVQSLASGIVTASDTDASAASNNDETSLLQALDAFRNNSALSSYQITTYTYDPLIGVRSITPPSGVREVYLYDTANRLKEIRQDSQTGKLLKEFKYNYKN